MYHRVEELGNRGEKNVWLPAHAVAHGDTDYSERGGDVVSDGKINDPADRAATNLLRTRGRAFPKATGTTEQVDVRRMEGVWKYRA
jgi:hypothetical protein